KGRVVPHWIGDGRFWYRNDLRGGAREFVLVVPEQGTRQPAFDHGKLADALSKAAGSKYQSDRLPFNEIEFEVGAPAIRFKVGDKVWRCDLESYACAPSEKGISTDPRPAPDEEEPRGARNGRRRREEHPGRSPDSKWLAITRDHNVRLRPAEDEADVALTFNGTADQEYGMLEWSPDSKYLVAWRMTRGEDRPVHLIESSPQGGGRARLHTRPYPLPGDKFPTYELHLFDAAEGREIPVAVDIVDFDVPRLRWRRDGHTFTYSKIDRGHQRYRLIEVDAATGRTRNLIDERTETFIWTAHRDGMNLRTVTWLDNDNELIYISERDGWRHLYLIDAAPAAGDESAATVEFAKVTQQITRGDFVVRSIERIDQDRRQIWFSASGAHPDQDPYFLHFYRVNFDGTGLVALTDGNGQHSVQFSPDYKYLIDTWSRVDTAPVHELRQTSDGKLVCDLEQADISELQERGWKSPEVFSAKGRDGTTDIWGIICRPANFDPNRRYPVIESIYAGPQGSFVPKAFNPQSRFQSLTDLGFIVVQIDGMGTANRSKAFHDVCWKNLRDAGLPDRILWHKAVAARDPSYDITRVGIYGGSAGGQNSTAALLFHPEFYKVAVSGCGCHDNRMDKASWNEQWMGYPVGPQYAESSNIDNAHRLRGKLLLIVGEMDTNVPPESTLRLADALIRARKDFELVVVPGAGHGMGGPYGDRKLRDFFVRHLHGVMPPERNGEPEEGE
ncbi:MAG TPA: prolyl oligopeptidase family serine peptidase, partial [Planctomycetaceae bacterium]|nr:prolyl oligopeptidase family serine peptidase [Planctomycetaceae bacterium]